MTKQQTVGLTILTTLLAVLGNVLALPLLFGVEFLFGSVIVLLALRLWGLTVALPAALIASSYTFYLWGHPYAIVIFTLEVLAVWWLMRRGLSLAVADGMYWLLLGMPLVWLFYSQLVGVGSDQAVLIMLKQSVNGLSNALLATCLLYAVASVLLAYKRPSIRIELKEAVHTSLLVLSLLSALALIVHQNYKAEEEYLLASQERMEVQAQAVAKYLAMHEDEPQELVHAISLFPAGDEMALLGADGQVLLATGGFDAAAVLPENGKQQQLRDGLYIWWPARGELPLMLWWKKALYFIDTPLQAGQVSKIRVMQPSRIIMGKIQQHQIQSFLILVVVIVVAGIISWLLSRVLTNKIIELAGATRNIVDKLRLGKVITWPTSSISELAMLSEQAKEMSQHVADSFNEVNLQATSIIENSIDGIVTIDDRGRIESFNATAERMFGYQRKEVIGENVKLLMPESFAVRHDRFIDTHLQQRPPGWQGSRREVMARRKDGSEFPIELSVSEIKLKRGVIFNGIIADITVRKQAERLKREFISTVSHELRTPLTSIKGSVGLLQSGIFKDQPEEMGKMLEVTSRNIERLSSLINDLLDFEKIDSNGMVYDLQQVNVAEVLQRAYDDNLPFATKAGSTLQLLEVVPVTVCADPSRLQQIITNYISNAVKFSPRGGAVQLQAVLQQDQVCISVRDEGDGVPDSFVDKIFQRFSQADSSDTRSVQKGTGLGLAICKRMAEDMGGSVGFYNNPDRGATFYLLLPLEECSGRN